MSRKNRYTPCRDFLWPPPGRLFDNPPMTDTNRLCEPRSGGQGGVPLSSAVRRSPGRPARIFQCLLLSGAVLAGGAGCVTPSVPMAGAAFLTAHPNPAPEGAYTVSWTPVGGASRYRLHENGALAYDGPELSHPFADKADGSYTYALTYCVVAFGIEACNFRAPIDEVTVTVTRP